MSEFKLVSSQGTYYPDENPPRWEAPELCTSAKSYDPMAICAGIEGQRWMFSQGGPSRVDFLRGSDFKLTSHRDADPVTSPSHYIDGRKYEPRLVIQDWKLGWELGNALKYIARAGRKDDEAQDIRKAIEYLKYRLEVVEG